MCADDAVWLPVTYIPLTGGARREGQINESPAPRAQSRVQVLCLESAESYERGRALTFCSRARLLATAGSASLSVL